MITKVVLRFVLPFVRVVLAVVIVVVVVVKVKETEHTGCSAPPLMLLIGGCWPT